MSVDTLRDNQDSICTNCYEPLPPELQPLHKDCKREQRTRTVEMALMVVTGFLIIYETPYIYPPGAHWIDALFMSTAGFGFTLVGVLWRFVVFDMEEYGALKHFEKNVRETLFKDNCMICGRTLTDKHTKVSRIDKWVNMVLLGVVTPMFVLGKLPLIIDAMPQYDVQFAALAELALPLLVAVMIVRWHLVKRIVGRGVDA